MNESDLRIWDSILECYLEILLSQVYNYTLKLLKDHVRVGKVQQLP